MKPVDASKVQFRYGKLDLAWVLLLVVVGGALSAVMSETALAFSVSLSGILCVGLIAIGRREGYLIGLYNSFSYSILAYGNGLYGELYLNLFFYVPTGVLGYMMWRRYAENAQAVVMRQLALPHLLLIVLACVIFSVALGFLLALNPAQNTPFHDATTNVLAVVATFLMMWRYKEQWLFYIALNVVAIVMWWLRSMAGGDAGDLMVLMWSLFLANAIFGYWRWHVGAKEVSALGVDGHSVEVICDAV